MYTITQRPRFSTAVFSATITIDTLTVQYPLTIKHDFCATLFFVQCWDIEGRARDCSEISIKHVDESTLVIEPLSSDFILDCIKVVLPVDTITYTFGDGKSTKFTINLNEENPR